jgi:hypothetical protein
VEEELLFSTAPSRLDYFKQGVHFDKRIIEKFVHNRTLKAENDTKSVIGESDNGTGKRVSTDTGNIVDIEEVTSKKPRENL